MPKMKKMLSLLAIPLAQAVVVSAFAQTPAATDPSASKSRAEVKAGASAANADKVNEFTDRPGPGATGTKRADVKAGAKAADIEKNIEYQDKPTAGMPAGNKSRAEVKAERNASGSQLRANTEVPTPGTSSQPNLKNPQALTPEERAARREARRQKAAERRAKRAAARRAAGPDATMPANGGAGGGNPAPGK
jgi:hypothetical protein